MKKLSAVVLSLMLCVSVSFAARGGSGSSSGSSSKTTKSSSSSSGQFGIGYSRMGARVVNVTLDQIAARYWINNESSAAIVPALNVFVSLFVFISVFIHDVVGGDALVEFLGLLGVDTLDELGRYSAP